jgi:hypothetical protein
MTHARYVIDRFEDGGWAVLEREDGTSLDVPSEWLPEGAIEGHILTLSLEATAESSRLTFTIDSDATAQRLDELRKLRERLPKGPDGDFEL